MLLKSNCANDIFSLPLQLANAMENCLEGATLEAFGVLKSSLNLEGITRLVLRYLYFEGVTIE